jgi:histidine triad (HIT) family protein
MVIHDPTDPRPEVAPGSLSEVVATMGRMPETADEPTVFSRIVAHEIPADIVFESDTVVAFRDIAPQAPVHLLVVPTTQAYRDVVELAAGDPSLLAEMVDVASRLAADPSVFGEHSGAEFRLIFNTGASAGQTVFHVHAHVLGGPLQEGTLAH